MLDHEAAIRSIHALAAEAIKTRKYLAALEAIQNILFRTQIKEGDK